ncbi:MAG: orotidine-5'-phosphate decarboxylase [Candidatus Nomurabacteria bacterium]|nr:orotidine-5'-phosphate decarboxylase [Candidatus Nomurabacteria bacterium]
MINIPNFTDRCIKAIREKQTVLICGLDPQLRFMPPCLIKAAVTRFQRSYRAISELFFSFNRQIIDAVEPFIFAVKPQMAFYEAYGHWGMHAFERTVAYAHSKGLIVIEDAKRGDGGDTADAYASGHIGKVDFFGEGDNLCAFTQQFSPVHVDCLTVQPGIGEDCVGRFVKAVKQHGTGIFVVTKSSFRPNSKVEQLETKAGRKVWEEIASMVSEWGQDTEGKEGYRNVGVVMGATFPGDAPTMRKILPRAWFLIPGYGGQGGTADEAVVGINEDGFGGGVNSSRALIYAFLKGQFVSVPENFANAAEKAARFSRNELNDALRRANKFNY